MKTVLAHLLRHCGLLSFDLLCTTQQSYPNPTTLHKGDVVIVSNDGVNKWACLLCPGGCGAYITLSLNRARKPSWRIRVDFWGRPTIEPSIRQTNDCGCHFFIRAGRIEWCKDGRPCCLATKGT
jgi:hypothetical protein